MGLPGSTPFYPASMPTADTSDLPIGPKGPTKAAVAEAVRSIGQAHDRLAGAANEIDASKGHLDLDEAQNWLAEARLFVVQAERMIQYARDLRGH